MNEHQKPTETENVPCEVCLKEVPRTDAKNAEVNDYVLYFCGLDCYGKWREEKKEKK